MNKKVFQFFLIVFSLFSLFPFLGGCASFNTDASQAQSSEQEEKIDSSCAYFYFLWGTHAEYDQRFEEALEAYEKAAICDPSAEYVTEKIPILLIRLGKMQESAAWLQTYISDHPKKNVQRFLLARLQIQEGNIQQALELYEEALTFDPENRNIHLRLGILYSQQKQYDKAKIIFQDLLDKDPDLYFATLYLARLSIQTKEFEYAAQQYKQALSINWSQELIYEMVEFYNLQKKYTKSLALYDEILTSDPDDERAALGRIQALLYLDRDDEAIRMLTDIRQVSDEPLKIDLIISQIFINREHYTKAEPILLSLVQKQSNPETHYLLAIVYIELNKLDEALETLKQIPPDAEEYEYSVYLQVKIFNDTQQFEKARSLLEACIVREHTRKPIYYTYLASLYKDNDNNISALKTLADGVEEFPQDESLHFEYGLLLETTGNSDQAISIMKKVLELHPNHPEALNFIGYTWANQNQNLKQALEYIQQAVLQKPDSGYIRDSLGWVYFRLGKFEQAKIELENAVALEPADPHIYDHLGDTYRAMTNREKALEKYRKAFEMFTEDNKKKMIQDKIDALSES